MNVEFVLIVDTRRKSDVSAARLKKTIREHENQVLDAHPECRKSDQQQGALFCSGS